MKNVYLLSTLALLLAPACAADGDAGNGPTGNPSTGSGDTTASTGSGAGGDTGSTTTSGAGGMAPMPENVVLLIPDSSEDAIGIYDAEDGTFLGNFLEPNTESDAWVFSTPINAVQGPNGNIFVSDQVEDAVLEFDTGGAFVGIFADETDGLSRVIDEVPKGRRVTAVIHQPSTYAFRGGVLIHAAAYYGARTGGEYAFNFARYASVPLNFRPGTQPAWPQKGWEFFPQDYNPSCGYARYYDVVILRAPEELADAPDADLAALVFGDDAGRVTPLAREGRYAAFDSEGIPPDGTY